ncbi:MAG: hypothetical protein R3Y16_02220 [Rikenellaceae bacterium]
MVPRLFFAHTTLKKGKYEFKPLITDGEGERYLPWFVKITKR